MASNFADESTYLVDKSVEFVSEIGIEKLIGLLHKSVNNSIRGSICRLSSRRKVSVFVLVVFIFLF